MSRLIGSYHLFPELNFLSHLSGCRNSEDFSMGATSYFLRLGISNVKNGHFVNGKMHKRSGASIVRLTKV
jgi:hypothetical protein